jgi:hypothetical protein
MEVLYEIQKNANDVRDMIAVESALFHLPTALSTKYPDILVSFSAISIRDISALLSSPQLNITKEQYTELTNITQQLCDNISKDVTKILPRKNIFS